MIACEQKLISVKKDYVTTRMAGCRNDEQLIIQLNGISPLDYLFDAETSCTIFGVHHPFTTEPLTKQVVIRHVVFVRQQHSAHATHRFDPFE